ncbi:MAG: protein phosphatase 2C domain-containing protein, partial [Akkermansia sp.]|nr:protein phosphatase 2C domain-containing protein [Akkermansia sp.]
MLYTPQFYISVGCAQWIGAREMQEDRISAGVADEGQTLLALLADGMGGEADGHLAAECVTQNVEAEFFSSSNNGKLPPDERLHQALLLANIALGKKKKARHIDADAGCTLIALTASQEGLCWLSVGDSLLYRQYGNSVEKLNTAHTWEWELARRVVKGTMSAEEA